MKKYIAIMTLICMLLCGCSKGDDNTGNPTFPQNTRPHPEKLTVYLLEKADLADTGYINYQYDGKNNVTGYTVFTLEDEEMFRGEFSDFDANGMARSYQAHGERYTVSYYTNGKLQQMQIEDSGFSGNRWVYNDNGELTERQEYYRDELTSVERYVYENGVLVDAWGEDNAGNRLYECKISKGLVTEIVYADALGGETYVYEYDENGNMIAADMVVEGETVPVARYSYRAVEVDYDRGCCLLEQQSFLRLVTT